MEQDRTRLWGTKWRCELSCRAVRIDRERGRVRWPRAAQVEGRELPLPRVGWVAPSLRDGLEETLTLGVLGMTVAWRKTLRSTNPIENLNGGGGAVHAQRAALAQRVDDPAPGDVSARRRRTRVPSRAGLPRDARPDLDHGSTRQHRQWAGGKAPTPTETGTHRVH